MSSPEGYLWSLRAAAGLFLLIGAALSHRRSSPRILLRGAAAVAGVLTVLVAGWRTVEVGHLPLAGLHETLLVFGSFLALAALAPALRYRLARLLGLCLCGSGLLWLLASLAPAGPTPLVPALQTLWFEIHVASSFAAYACFGLSAAAATLSLAAGGREPEQTVVRAANAWGFAWFTWGMVSGGIWAYLAWGTYWLWHVKELWSAIIWTYYAGIIHLPHLSGWRRARLSGLSIAGFAVVLFTYLGVGLLMQNTHRF